MFISKSVKCRQLRENKEETIRDKRTEEKGIREQKNREEKKIVKRTEE